MRKNKWRESKIDKIVFLVFFVCGCYFEINLLEEYCFFWLCVDFSDIDVCGVWYDNFKEVFVYLNIISMIK